jgi:hypothetical protein
MDEDRRRDTNARAVAEISVRTWFCLVELIMTWDCVYAEYGGLWRRGVSDSRGRMPFCRTQPLPATEHVRAHLGTVTLS